MSYINKLITAREFRSKPTKSEDKLWQSIKRKQINGYIFRRQYVISGFILDFYCVKLKLAIEVDGEVHSLEDNKDYDFKRENILKQNNLNFIRFTNNEIENNILTVLSKIEEKIRSLELRDYL